MSAASLQKRLNMGHEIRRMSELGVFLGRKNGSKKNLDQILQVDCELLYATAPVTLKRYYKPGNHFLFLVGGMASFTT